MGLLPLGRWIRAWWCHRDRQALQELAQMDARERRDIGLGDDEWLHCVDTHHLPRAKIEAGPDVSQDPRRHG
jgi:hypothetical protein